MENHSIRMEDELWELCQQAAKVKGMSASAYVRGAILRQMEVDRTLARMNQREYRGPRFEH